jgi:glyoxylase-like metal-dependent hydrolase (beta-lactamase superfamily II)
VSLRVTTFVNGRWKQNCYIVSSDGGDAIVIDPGSQADELIHMIETHGWQVHGIINTHGHFDHIGAVVPLQQRYPAPFYLHKSDERLMQRANLFRMVFEARDAVKIPTITQDISALPEKFAVGPFSISWIPTPGHTEGSVCLQLGNMLFSGDTLMQNAIGRTDLPGGNRDQLLASVKKLSTLPAETEVYGGHGEPTTVGAEFAPGSRVWSLLQ